MTISFHIRFHTTFGQQLFVSGNVEQLGNNDISAAFLLSYLSDEYWGGSIELDVEKQMELSYQYILRDGKGEVVEGEEERRSILSSTTKELIVVDSWNDPGNPENSFFTQPFSNVIFARSSKETKRKLPSFVTHEFRIKAPLLSADETVCILGSGRTLNEWETNNPLLLFNKNGWFSIQISLVNSEFPVEYKYGIFNSKEKKFKEFEQGENRVLNFEGGLNKLVIVHDGFLRIKRPYWKGAGIAIPVFSLRTNNGFGVGEFNDLRLLADWAKQTSLRMIQILPVNDTTCTNTWQDSYPYSAISAFALHPLYIHLDAVAGDKHKQILSGLKKKQKKLNMLPEVDYEQVLTFKLSVLRELFDAQKDAFETDPEYIEFFGINSEWLIPYAAFSYLRDKNKTADYSKWKIHSIYNAEVIRKFVSPSQKRYSQLSFYYFVQYHLHKQLLAASEYAHKNGIILKGDIPIGISRNSVDSWIAPQSYKMDQQAGAPPDDFAIKGQNWGFPTYNWKQMQADGYSWWRKRFTQMSKYFDAFRIDHILGFFRIWSIPIEAVEGILGKFDPVIPIHISAFHSKRIWFEHDRYCKPYITDHILELELGDQVDFVKENFLDTSTEPGRYQFKPAFDSQHKIDEHISEMADDGSYIRQGLFNLMSNVILIEEKNSQGQEYHFRIAMDQTNSFKSLDEYTQKQLLELYIDYFFRKQDELWKKEALSKLPVLKRSTNMLICGEDLGMVPDCLPEVMQQLAILSLEIQRMPKDPSTAFFLPKNAPYLSVVTPSTHDMSTIRGWWEENKTKTQLFYNLILGHYGEAPAFCEPGISREIVIQHLFSPAMWSVFQMQDLLGMSQTLRRENPNEERINQPADPKHYWRYRIHLPLETLIKERTFNEEVKSLVLTSGRGN